MVYRLLSSLKTSVYVLAVMCLFFLVGTIFPQGENIDDYIGAGGKYVPLVRGLDFLDIFMSPLFLLITALLLANLAVCLYDRLRIFLRIRRSLYDFKTLKGNRNAITFKADDLEARLRKIGFRLKAESRNGVHPGVKLYEKGLPYWWLSWCYHVGIILAITGFFMTSLFAFEKSVLLYPGEPQTISLFSEDTRWHALLNSVGREISPVQGHSEYELTLQEFSTEFYQGLRLDYPKEKLEKLALGLGMKKLEPSKKGFSYRPKMWRTRLNVKGPDGEIPDAVLWVNKPFRTGSLTLYQMGYEQKVKLSVRSLSAAHTFGSSYDVKGEIINTETGVPFRIKNVSGKFMLGTLTLGTLFKRDGTTEEITPVTSVYYISDDGPSEREELGELSPGGRLHAKDLLFEFRDYKEGSYLSYRKDPGVWLVGLACLFVFLGLFVRSLGAWYRIQYAEENKNAHVLISTRGILADKDRLIRNLSR